VIDIVYIAVLVIGTLIVMSLGAVVALLLWTFVMRPHEKPDISCPDCGVTPHRPGCRFAWMGPPPTSFVVLDPTVPGGIRPLDLDHHPTTKQESENT